MDIKKYEDLAKRNGWDFSMQDGRPYFMKDGKYAVPDSNTSFHDKMLLSQIISEGSIEMAKLIMMCWENGIIIAGPCSGIAEYHDNKNASLHFGFIGNPEVISLLYEKMSTIFPNSKHLYRNDSVSGNDRYDFGYSLESKYMTKEEADYVFNMISTIFMNVVDIQRQNVR